MWLLLVSGCQREVPAEALADTITWHHDVAPIITGRCASCHDDSTSAPFVLTDYASVTAAIAPVIAAISDGTMPPWPPSPDCNTYQADRSLTEEQVQVIVDWAEDGMPEGDPDDPGEALPELPGLSRVDLTLQMFEPYTPTTLPDDYRCFLLEWPLTEEAYVTGFSTQPGSEMVHHATAFKVPAERADAYIARAGEDADYGYSCFGGPGQGSVWIAGWSPGTQGTDFPEGTGVLIEPDALIGFQIHYNTTFTEPAADQTSIELKIDDTVTHPARTLRLWDPQWLEEGGMKIPAGQSEVTWSMSHTEEGEVTIFSGNLHMHTLGTAATLDILRADGSEECILDLPQWDFDWQGDYFLTSPLLLSPSDTLRMSCQWDNSGGDDDVYWGESTLDEMCTGKLYVIDAAL